MFENLKIFMQEWNDMISNANLILVPEQRVEREYQFHSAINRK
jgi:hypothetical protein